MANIRSQHTRRPMYLEVPPQAQHRGIARDSKGSHLIDEWEKQNGVFSKTFEGIAAGGIKFEPFQ